MPSCSDNRIEKLANARISTGPPPEACASCRGSVGDRKRLSRLHVGARGP
jgi:hypothetical protein